LAELEVAEAYFCQRVEELDDLLSALRTRWRDANAP